MSERVMSLSATLGASLPPLSSWTRTEPMPAEKPASPSERLLAAIVRVSGVKVRPAAEAAPWAAAAAPWASAPAAGPISSRSFLAAAAGSGGAKLVSVKPAISRSLSAGRPGASETSFSAVCDQGAHELLGEVADLLEGGDRSAAEDPEASEGVRGGVRGGLGVVVWAELDVDPRGVGVGVEAELDPGGQREVGDRGQLEAGDEGEAGLRAGS
jgi:hypothetical protein